MNIYSLSGPSGTGKSTSALEFAHTHHIEAIIDDGLLIVRGKKVAGTSAKFEKNSMTAVKRAIFLEDDHCAKVRAAIEAEKIQSLLIIGTSDKMTKQIAKRLELGDIGHFYTIADIRTEREIKMAKFVRSTQGKHVMPIPHKQVEQNFFKRLVQKGKDIFSHKREKIGETTIVYPDFHQEMIYIHKAVYQGLLQYTVESNSVVAKLDKLHFEVDSQLPEIEADVILIAPVTYSITEEMKGLQKDIDNAFEAHFGIHTGRIVLRVKGLERAKE